MRFPITSAGYFLGIFLSISAAGGIQAQEGSDGGQEAKKGADQASDSRRQALELLVEAEIALEGGHTARASALAREAQRLYPESKSIAGFLTSLAADSASAVRPGASTQNRAKAHLAAALSRAQVLMQQRRYTESLDLLNGIVEATGMFPQASDVSLYRDLAQKELIEYRVGVQTGKIRPNAETPSPKVTNEPPDAATSAALDPEFPAAPSNAFRLARIARDQTPAWYSKTKTALRRSMSVDYNAMPLGLVLDDIQTKTGITVIVDTPLQSAKTTITSVVDLRVGSVPAETVLYLATQVAGCEYVLLERGIVVTTTDKAGDYIRNLPDSVSNQWARARYLFPDLYVDAMATRPLPEAKVDVSSVDERADTVPPYLRSGRDLVAHIEQLVR